MTPRPPTCSLTPILMFVLAPVDAGSRKRRVPPGKETCVWFPLCFVSRRGPMAWRGKSRFAFEKEMRFLRV